MCHEFLFGKTVRILKGSKKKALTILTIYPQKQCAIGAMPFVVPAFALF
jgi:hypothetical protein